MIPAVASRYLVDRQAAGGLCPVVPGAGRRARGQVRYLLPYLQAGTDGSYLTLLSSSSRYQASCDILCELEMDLHSWRELLLYNHAR